MIDTTNPIIINGNIMGKHISPMTTSIIAIMNDVYHAITTIDIKKMTDIEQSSKHNAAINRAIIDSNLIILFSIIILF